LALADKPDVASVIEALSQQLQSELQDIEQAAVNGLAAMNADDRQQVRGYYTALWLWNRLEGNRWEKAQVALRQESRRENRLEVDHIVAYDLWQSKLNVLKQEALTEDAVTEKIAELAPVVNQLGNCMLLEKNFNISKSNIPLKQFLEGVHEFKNGRFTVEEWAKALDLEMPQVDSANTSIDDLHTVISQRTQEIRSDLEQFVRGLKGRIDL
jgi:5-methylcytosine-specific restriction endonuclease McrA